MKNTKKKLNSQSKIVKASFSGSNITKYSGLNTVAKYIHPVKLVSDLAKLFYGVKPLNQSVATRKVQRRDITQQNKGLKVTIPY